MLASFYCALKDLLYRLREKEREQKCYVIAFDTRPQYIELGGSDEIIEIDIAVCNLLKIRSQPRNNHVSLAYPFL